MIKTTVTKDTDKCTGVADFIDFKAVSEDGLYMLERCESRENGTLGGFEWVEFKYDRCNVFIIEEYEEMPGDDVETRDYIEAVIKNTSLKSFPIYGNASSENIKHGLMPEATFDESAGPLVGVLVFDKDNTYTDDQIENIKLDYLALSDNVLYSYDVCIYQKAKHLVMPASNVTLHIRATDEEVQESIDSFASSIRVKVEYDHQCSLQVNSSRVLRDLDYFIADANSEDPKCLCIYREAFPFIAEALTELKKEVEYYYGK